MALTSIYTLDPRVAIKISRTPPIVRKRALREAARYFCRSTGVWRETLAAIETVADQADYTVTVPTDGTPYAARILRVSRAKLEGAELNQALWTFAPDHVFSFVTAPTAAGDDLVLDVVFDPLDGCYLYPDWLVERWDQAFVAGALHDLYEERGDKRAARWGREFQSEIARARGLHLDGRQSGAIIVARREFI
ncbi:MAG TPA: hypothetical protein PLG73_09065 [Candidatus Sumerlaeota bacterium]|nr:hypothetical protein [Candidatus Sumerlaeota bacterium]